MDNRDILKVQLAIVFILVALISSEVIIVHSEWFAGEPQETSLWPSKF
jgi:hypothetical protein